MKLMPKLHRKILSIGQGMVIASVLMNGSLTSIQLSRINPFGRVAIDQGTEIQVGTRIDKASYFLAQM